jgi:flagellar L-ring protein precursor FlgH
MKPQNVLLYLAASFAVANAAEVKKAEKHPPASPLDDYVNAAESQALNPAFAPTAGAIWSPGANFADLGRDLRASQVNDLVTIVVKEAASATTGGATKTQRKSSGAVSVTSIAGVTKPAGALANLAGFSGDRQLDGSGSTSRETAISTVVSARVVRVLPNGYLVLEGSKDVQVNSERQTVTVRGVIRPTDLTPDNSVLSHRLAQLEIRLNGKGVVGDAIKRPFFLYRLLMGLLPI